MGLTDSQMFPNNATLNSEHAVMWTRSENNMNISPIFRLHTKEGQESLRTWPCFSDIFDEMQLLLQKLRDAHEAVHFSHGCCTKR